MLTLAEKELNRLKVSLNEAETQEKVLVANKILLVQMKNVLIDIINEQENKSTLTSKKLMEEVK